MTTNGDVQKSFNGAPGEVIREGQSAIPASAVAVFYEFDLSHKTFRWSVGLEKLAGYPTDEVSTGFDWWLDRLHPEDRDHYQRSLSRTADLGVEASVEYRIRAKNGTWIRVVDRMLPASMEAGRPTHLLGSVQSLSPQIGQEMKREVADEQLLKIVHDMRSPLGAIQIWVQLLKQASLGEEEEARAIQSIANSSGMLGMLVDEMLDLSRLATGRLRLELRPLKLAPLIESAVAAAGPVASARGIRLLRTLHSEPGPVAGDAERIQRALRIILSNAFDFTPRGGCVDVSLKRSGSDACILVRDGGSAAHPDLFPGASSPDIILAKRKNEMSLEVAHHLVKLHGGSITVESVGEGRPNTFTVSIPLVDPRTPPKPLGQGSMKLRPT